ncbi:hypothetical protein D9757_003267 [Collybiopsis confluens]|uniref:Uncharacterized protein n=1 Tax=Collybiopsis confluens TaxID=2823264 RepID=A0A8H5MFI6_9AGAR|nr:hypothetical protein D9757_003267 [Collybiopsis confluens]
MSPAHIHTVDLEKGTFETRETAGLASNSTSPTQPEQEQYERLLLNASPKVGNPTPLALISFIMVLAPTAFVQMGWGSSSLASSPVFVGSYYLLGGLALIIAGVMEWIVGNTLACIVDMMFGGNWLSLAVVLDPVHGIASAFPEGINSPDYNKAFMFYYAIWTFPTLTFFVASLRINVAFAGVFFNVTFANAVSAAAYGALSQGNTAVANALVIAAGAFEFVVVCFASYIYTSMLFESVNMPFKLPLGDLSRLLSRKAKLT